ncbi:MAG: hypothetical protein IPL49_16595 [Saprospirales bacterium]|nr:hypothetical protein [Saprospirales bacterium]
MANSLFQYWLESTIGLLLFWGLYRVFRTRLSLIFRKSFLILTPALAIVIPLLDWNLPDQSSNFADSSLFDSWLERWEHVFRGTVQITGVSLLSLVYFFVTAVLLFRLIDRLAASWQQLDYWHALEVLMLEGGLALLWFQPMLFLFRREVGKVEGEGIAAKSSIWAELGLALPALGATFLLSWLFAADQICHAPMWNQVESKTNEWQARLEAPLFQLGAPMPAQTLMGWGGYWTTFTPLPLDSLALTPVRLLSPFEYYTISGQLWTWRKDGWDMTPHSVSALAVFPFQTDPVHLNSFIEIQHFLDTQRFATEMTLFLKIEDEGQQPWLGVIGVSEKGRVYGFDDVLQNWGPSMPLLHWRKGNNGRTLAELVPHSPYRVVWGDLNLPLDLRANPNVYGGNSAVDLEEMQSYLDHPIRFYYGDSLLAPESVSVREMDEYSRPNNNFSGVRTVRRDSVDTYLETGQIELRPATTWTIIASLPGEVSVNAISIYIRDTDAPYDPPVSAQKIPRVDSLFSFQLVTRNGLPSKLRIDTTLARNQRIIDMYRFNDSYQIIHLPGFETFDRLVQMPDNRMSLVREEGLPVDSIFMGDQLPELSYETLGTLYLEWGNLFAAPNSKVYSLEECMSQLPEIPSLHTPGKTLEIRSFVMYVFREDKPLHALWYSPDQIAQWQVDSLATWIRPKTSLFLDQIVVADANGELFAVPLSFALHIGKSERDIRWKVTIEQVPAWEVGEPERVEDAQSLKFQNYQLSDLIARLALHPKNRMEFRGLKDDPVVNVQLSADGPLPARAQEFLLNELQKRYRFEFSYERLDRPNWRLHLKDPDLLNRAIFEGETPPEENIRVFQWDGTHVLTGVTLNELGYHLEERFDEIIEWFPNAFLDDRFSFSLNCSSLGALQLQLETEYGIVFQRMDTLWQGMVVRFY